MKVHQLKALLKDKDDNLEVMIPVTGEFGEFEGFVSPCPEESRSLALGDDDYEDSLVLVPCGFFDEPMLGGVPPELN